MVNCSATWPVSFSVYLSLLFCMSSSLHQQIFSLVFSFLYFDAMEERKYNLRSRRSQEHVIPIQLQMASDADFISQSLCSSHPTPRQVFLSDQSLSTSESELDISGLMEDLDFNSSRSDRDVHFKHEKSKKSAGCSRLSGQSDPNSDTVSQNDINKKILAQLQSLGDRLDCLEKKPVKKTSDRSKVKSSKKTSTVSVAGSGSVRTDTVTASGCMFPSPSDLRQDAKIQQGVQLRLRELADNAGKGNEKIKSQGGGGGGGGAQWMFMWAGELNGRMNLSWQAMQKIGCLIISLPLYSGWLAFVGP